MRAAAALLSVGLAAAPALAHPGVGVVVAADGSVFYTDLKNVYRLDPSGTRTVAVPGVHTHELFLDADGALFGEHLWYEGEKTDRWGHYVWKRAPDGKVSKVVPDTPGFRNDVSFVRDRAGAMYWASDAAGTTEARVRTVVRKRSADGRIATLASGFVDIRWMAATPGGRVYLIDEDRLRRVDPDGTVMTVASGLTRGWLRRRHDVMGLAPADDGTVYVARPESGEVLRIAPGGGVTVFAKSAALWSPTGVAVARGSVYVLESGLKGARVRKLTLAGEEAAWEPARPRPPG